MNKGLKALEYIKNFRRGFTFTAISDKGIIKDYNYHTIGEAFSKEFDIIETALKRLEEYDFMFHNNELYLTKEKEALKRTDAFRMGTDSEFNKSGYNFDDYHKDMNTLRKALDTLETLRQMRNDKQDEVLRIIKEKEVEIGLLKGILHADKSFHTASYYNSHFVATYRHLTKAEFDLLKEWLE